LEEDPTEKQVQETYPTDYVPVEAAVLSWYETDWHRLMQEVQGHMDSTASPRAPEQLKMGSVVAGVAWKEPLAHLPIVVVVVGTEVEDRPSLVRPLTEDHPLVRPLACCYCTAVVRSY